MEILALVLLGLFAGALASALGIGGGIIFVPALVTFFGFSQIEAQGTSLAIIVPTAIIATIGHARHKRIIWPIAITAGLVGIVGAILGSELALRLDEKTLSRVFSILLIVLAVRMAHRAWTLRPSAASVDPT